MTEIAYPKLSVVEGIFKDLVWGPLVKSALVALFVQYPWLNIWPIKPIVEVIITRLSDRILVAATLVVDLNAISFVNNVHQKAYDRALTALKIVIRDHGIDSQEFKDAKEEAKKALSSFVRYG